MSTRCTIQYARDEATGQGFHVYVDLLDEGDCVMLEIKGMTFETSVRFAPSGRPEMRVRGAHSQAYGAENGPSA